MFPPDWQEPVLSLHGDLYARHQHGFACVQIQDGAIRLGSVNGSPFGVQPVLDPSRFAPQSTLG